MKKPFISLFVLILLVELIWAGISLSRPLPVPRPKKARSTTALAETLLVLSPPKGSFKKEEFFEVVIILEAEEDVFTDGVDLILSFDPSVLAAQEIKNENLYSRVMVNEVDNQEGKIKFTAINPLAETEIKGGGKIATVTFQGKGEGTAQVEFEFIPGFTKDTNLAQSGTGTDILDQVVNGEYLIE